jgi:hypothetical protein
MRAAERWVGEPRRLRCGLPSREHVILTIVAALLAEKGRLERCFDVLGERSIAEQGPWPGCRRTGQGQAQYTLKIVHEIP